MNRLAHTLALFALALPAPLLGQITLNDFTNGTVADATKVNENFTRLKDGVTALTDLIAAIPIAKPGFRSVVTNANGVVIPASSTSPIVARIGTTLRTTTSPIVVDLATNGVGGLDTGIKLPTRTYYLYMVDGATAGTLAAIASLNPPTSGPQLEPPTTPWSYVGAFLSSQLADVVPFVSERGRYRASFTDASFQVTTSSTTLQRQALVMPPHAAQVFGRFVLSGGPTTGATAAVSSLDQIPTLNVISTDSTSGSIHYLEWPLLEPAAIHMRVDSSSATLFFRLLGWQEDPTRFR